MKIIDGRKLTDINMYSTKEEIDRMSLEQALEIIHHQVELGHKKGSYTPREHTTKAFELAEGCIKKCIQ